MQPSENAYGQQQSHPDQLNSLVGRSLGQFRIVERIGAGGMATVFKAYQPALDRYVAIKVLPAYHARDPVFVKRFVQEARSVARLAHPNIVQIHDFGEQDQVTYIVMEYVDGGTLKDRLKRPLPATEAVDYMIQAAEGLDCAHRNGIVHRDVKPANMLLRRDGHLLLSDFGIAKILEGTTNLTRAGTGIGTPQYMSPEQGTGQPVDRRSDIYSLGIVFFHCLTGRVPFTADNPLTITMKHLNEPLPVDLLRAVGVPAPIEQVVVRMTAKAPQDRYQTTEALIQALTAALMAANLVVPHPWRSSIGKSLLSQMGSALPAQSQPQPQPLLQPQQAAPPMVALNPRAGNQALEVTLTCFRCGDTSSSTLLFCNTCGYELADRKAANDRYVAPNGRIMLGSITMQSGPMAGRTFRFHQDVTTIGRINGNDFVIDRPSVSRRHARLWFNNGRWYLEDLQSSNGTMVNGERITQTVLNDGDVIDFGKERAVFRVIYK
jgi:serine/threonine protein kinase